MLKDIAGSGNLELDTTLSVAGKAADAKAVGDAIGRISSGNADLGVTGATIGQTVKIAKVDENGVPTAWESVDFPSGGGSGAYYEQPEVPEDAPVGSLWYDTDEEPPENSGGIIVTGAKVGQTVKISAVDENGVPTAWESVDFPSGGGGGSLHNPEFITAFSITEDGVKSVEVINGEVEYREVYIFFNVDGNCSHSQVTENARSFGIINDDWRMPLGDCTTGARAKYMHFNYMGIAEVTNGITISSFGGYPTFDFLIGFNPPYEGKVLPYKPIKKVELGLMSDTSYFAKDLHISVYGVRL